MPDGRPFAASLFGGAVATWLSGCAAAPDASPIEAPDCPTEPAPSVRLGNTDEGFAPLAGDLPPVQLVLGPQNSFHIWLSVWMEGFCRVASFDMELAWADAVGGALTPLDQATLRMELVRPAPGDDGFDAEHPSAQFVAGLRAFVPCDHYPRDPGDAGARCGEALSRAGFIEDGVARLAVDAEDREGHEASAAVWVQPVYGPAG